ncbi:caspase domain-containing protein [Asanoa ferruginea]|uniref:Caspase domain-containing protein n=1 Tax=Asanoa ferruginea TaxID=53367 RepID=A0A3D9ZUV8_9ACTN|nr:caspase family protein [Asanoa ferruginea]REG00283.1 caspase domain-containing protein [Asanoa ferruginea]GIF52126.1 hypothetical protein Afe04nite_66650 [Asanoa ferruginea]
MTPSESWAAPPLPAGPRKALIVAVADYTDAALRKLRSPTHDATALQSVLAETGGFEVAALADPGAGDVRGAIVDFVADCGRDDLALVYLSCHGLLDARRRLWFAAADTVKAKMAATGVEATWLMDRMADCRARQQVVVLDCCFSGAFAQGAKGDDEAALESQLKPRGTVVLTASGATEYSFEGEHLADAPQQSVFTAALVEGLRTGAADTDNDGLISVDDAFAFASDRLAGTGQTPQRWSYAAEGRIILARNPTGMRVTAAPIPSDIKALLQHPFPAVRAAGVDTLGEWLTGDQPGQVLAARAELRRIADDDLPRVGDKARTLLGEPTREQLLAAAEAETARLVEAARVSTDEVTVAARQAADQTIAAAKQEAGEIIATARQEAAGLLAEATQRLADAGKEADALVAGAKRRAAAAETVRPSPAKPSAREVPASAVQRPEVSRSASARKRAAKTSALLDGVALLWVGEPPLGHELGFDTWTNRGAIVRTAANLTDALRDVQRYPINALIWNVGWGLPRWSRLNDLRGSGYKGRIIAFTQSVSADLVDPAAHVGMDGIARNARELEQWLSSVAAKL